METGSRTRGRVAFRDVSSGKLGGGHLPKGRMKTNHYIVQMYPPYKRLNYPNTGYYSRPAMISK